MNDKGNGESGVVQLPLGIDRRKRQILEGLEKMNTSDSVDLFFLARPFASLSLPHRRTFDETKVSSDGKKVEALIHEVTNGRDRLIIEGSPSFGIPYGTYPRLFHFWVCSEIKRTGKGEVFLDNSLPGFMQDLGLTGRGGQRADFFDQVLRFLNANYRLESYDSVTGKVNVVLPDRPVSEYDIDSKWKQRGCYRTGGPARILFKQWFVEQILKSSVPFQREVIIGLKGSSLAMDLYTWITWRTFTLENSAKGMCNIPLTDFTTQLGVSYSRIRDFRRDIKKAYEEVRVFYPDADFRVFDDRVELWRAPPAVPSSGQRA